MPSLKPSNLTFVRTPRAGAVKSTDAERRALADKSHAWNIAQPKFKNMFPDYTTPAMRDLPNMSGSAPKPAGPQGEGKVPVRFKISVRARRGLC